MVVWCKEEAVPENVVCAEIPGGAENNSTVNFLTLSVWRLQIHKCCKEKCFSNSYGRPLNKCKYGFSYPMQEEEKMNRAGIGLFQVDVVMRTSLLLHTIRK